jgi:hypothetical protein
MAAVKREKNKNWIFLLFQVSFFYFSYFLIPKTYSKSLFIFFQPRDSMSWPSDSRARVHPLDLFWRPLWHDKDLCIKKIHQSVLEPGIYIISCRISKVPLPYR